MQGRRERSSSIVGHAFDWDLRKEAVAVSTELRADFEKEEVELDFVTNDLSLNAQIWDFRGD